MMRTQPIGDEDPPLPTGARAFADAPTARQRIFDNVLQSVQKFEPVSNTRHTLKLENVEWSGPEHYSKAEQKRAILEGRSLGRRLQGEWVLSDTASGNELGRKRALLARVPYLNDDGHFVLNGSAYTMANQFRLRPGIFTRRKENGELTAHVNVARGLGHHIFLDPESSVFKLGISQAELPLVPLLKAMGVGDQELRTAWGNELYERNAGKGDRQTLIKLYKKLVGNRPADDPDAARAVVREFESMTLDPEVTKRTLGEPFTNVNAQSIMATTRKLVQLNRGETEPDDRDAPAFQKLYGPEDFFAERAANGRGLLHRFLWKAASKGLGAIPSGALHDHMLMPLLGSGLAAPLEEINPIELFDQQGRVTRMGVGGIPDDDAIPDEARAVMPTQMGFVDPIRTPESGRVGVDTRFAQSAVKGANGEIYTKVRNVRTGKLEWKTPQELADRVLAFPNELAGSDDYVNVVRGGKLRPVHRSLVDYELPRAEDMFSVLSNQIPRGAQNRGQRMSMASRMLTQALPLINREAPLVQTLVSRTGRGVDEELGRHAGAAHTKAGGKVLKVTADEVVVKTPDGEQETVELWNNMPYNRKTRIHQTAVVEPGQQLAPGDLVATSNFTDKQGAAAMGLNARVAYVPWLGHNYEDAIVISESFAKRSASEGVYQHDADWGEAGFHRGKKAFLSSFASTYPREMLDKFTEDGVVKPGTKVEKGDPLVLLVKEREPNYKSMLKGRSSSFQDATVTWEHSSPGVVTDVTATDKGAKVIVLADSSTEVGDKLTGRHGNKGVVSKIIPDAEMPTDGDGQPFEVLLDPAGLPSRANAAQIAEAALGKIAARRGQPYRIPNFGENNEDDLMEFVDRELRKHGVPDKETILDPVSGRKIQNVFTGHPWLMKLHHTAEAKQSGRGLGEYTAELTPARGGSEGSKRIGQMELNSLLSHGVTKAIRDINLVRGQANPRFWSQYMGGFDLPPVRASHLYHKFNALLKAAGADIVRDGSQTHIMPMTNRAAEELTGDREITNAETVDWETMEPVPGGLFDPRTTGGHFTADGGGNRWGFIRLHEPLPNPVMEEPIRHLLGLTKPRLRDVLAGKEKLNGKTGPKAIQAALTEIDVDKGIVEAREVFANGKKSGRNNALKRLKYLLGAKNNNIHPSDWMLSRVPVLPPAFRPVSTMGPKKLPLVADPNYLYKELWTANRNLSETAAQLGDHVGDERLALYDSFKAVVGLGDPLQPKNQERQVKGILKHVFGNSPKFGFVNRRLLGSQVDLVGRATITPDPDLDMDQVGLPEDAAWQAYRPAIIRKLVRRGLPRLQAARAVEDRSPIARAVLDKELEDGVVILNRAPTHHRYGILAHRPKLVAGKTIRIPPIVTPGYGADFDGDNMNFHVPATEDEKNDAIEKMLPSKNLFSVAGFKAHYKPTQQYQLGLYEASARVSKEKPVAVYRTVQDAIRAYRNGEVDYDQVVDVLENK